VRRPLLFGGCIGLALLAGSGDAAAMGADEAYQSAQRALGGFQQSVANIRAAMQRASSEPRSAAQRLADGDLLLRNRDYDRAAIVFNEIVDKYRDNPTVYAEGLYLLGETYYRSKQLLSAKRVFKRVVQENQDSRLVAYRPTAVTRLVDIAIRTHDTPGLEEAVASMSQMPSSAEPVLAYARGRALIAKKDYASARRSLQSVPSTSPYYHQSMYLLGLVSMKESQALGASPAARPDAKSPTPPDGPAAQRGKYAAAVEAFRAVTVLSADTPEHKHVIDLSWLAIGRLLYETDQWAASIDAYNHIDRSSPEFGTMLFEMASVYVKLGDVQRAQRSLEILAIADPDSADIAEGSLLRGDLLLRAGQFKRALETYEAVRGQYDPMRQRVEEFLSSTNDPSVYYDRLAREQLEVTEDKSPLPPLAVQWARDAENGPEAFGVLDEVVKTRSLIRQSQSLVERLSVLMNAPNRVRAFSELRAGEQVAVATLNGVMRARVTVAEGLDDVEDSRVSGEMESVRAERRSLQSRVLGLPVSDADFQKRDESSNSQWNRVSQKVQQLNLQIDTLQSIINALRKVLRDSGSQGVVRDPASTRRLEDELSANERDLGLYRQRISDLRRVVDTARVGAGFGDQTFQEETSLRSRYKQLLAREVQLALTGAAGSKATVFATRVAPLISQADQIDSEVEESRVAIARKVEQKTKEVVDVVAGENAKITEYAAKLDALDQEARLVVGQVAMRNFGLVRDRLKSIVLRADVGVTEQAWEVREEQQTRVRNLQTERARAERLLDEELREVLDDTGEVPEGGKQP